MTVILVLLGTAALLIGVAPLLLTVGNWRMRYPRAALALWHGVFLGGLASATGSLVWSLVLGVTLHASRSTGFAGWFDPTAIILFGWVGLAGIGGLTALVFSQIEPMNQVRRRAQKQFILLAASASYRTVAMRGIEVVFIECDIPLALSVPGRFRRVLVTSGLERGLDAGELRAVIEHERAHLVQRHGWIAQLAQLNRACLPKLLGAKEFERATRLLIELIADDAAARVCGAPAASSALLKLGSIQEVESMVLRSQRIASRPPRLRSFTRGNGAAVADGGITRA